MKIKSILIVAFVLILSLTGCMPTLNPVVGADGVGGTYYPQAGNGGYDVQNYSIHLSVDPGEEFVKGTAEISIKALQSLKQFNFDFNTLQIDSITVNGATASFTQNEK